MTRWTSAAMISALLLTVYSAIDAQAPVTCRSGIIPQGGDLGYRLRDGQRCEGLYEAEAALGAMVPVSLVVADHPVPSDAFTLSWPYPRVNQRVAIEVSSFKRNVLYRMDVSVVGASFRWKADVLNALKFQEGEFGVVATTDAGAVGEPGERLYLPVVIARAGTAPKMPAGTRYLLKLASGVDLIGLSVAISGPVSKGVAPKVAAPRPLRMSYRANPLPLTIPLELPPTPGIYEVRLAAARRVDGLDTVTTFYILNGL